MAPDERVPGTGEAVRRTGIVVNDVRIPLPDGCELFARVWRPGDDEPAPAILEAHPYGIWSDDDPYNRYRAEHGYVGVRLDLRGTGNSDGVPHDEYVQQELDDIVEAIAWISSQPWCTGAVGMTGISWSGFNSLQVAALRPPALHAIVSLCSTDDRYADDLHYLGGGVLGEAGLGWSTLLLATHARPTNPFHLGENWLDRWRERLSNLEFQQEHWLTHQRRDAFWKQGSVCEDFSTIECPVLMVGGWADTYARGVLRTLAGTDRAWGIVGPWSHRSPEDGQPGPAIGFLSEEIRWWDHWLKGFDNGVPGDPRLRAYIRDPRSSRPIPATEPGRWIRVREWPPSKPPLALPLRASMLGLPGVGDRVTIRTPEAAGMDTPVTIEHGDAADSVGDQRGEDGRAVCFTSAPLETPLEILGMPQVTLTLASNCPVATLAVRLCHVLPDGASRLLTLGMLNLAHRDGHENPVAIEPGEPMTLTVQLRPIGQRLPAGHRLRVALSSNLWPWVWPAPEQVELTLFLDRPNRLDLPTRSPGADEEFDWGQPEELPASFSTPEGMPDLPDRTTSRTVTYDVESGRTTVGWDGAWIRGSDTRSGMRTDSVAKRRSSVVEGDPLSARVTFETTGWFEREDGWRCVTEISSSMQGDRENFILHAKVVARHGKEVVMERTFDHTIPRDLN